MNRIHFVKDDTYDFIKSLDNKISAKIFRMLEMLDEVGMYLDPTKLKKVNQEIYELRVVGKLQVRIFCCFKNDLIYILHGFVKKTQKIPKNELQIAMHRLRLVL